MIAAKAVAFKEALSPAFKEYAQQVIKNAAVLADTLTADGFRIVSGGTDNHLMLVDLRSKDLTGKEAEHILDEAGITANKNTIPYEPLSPFVTSGIRLGSAALTTRGFKEEDMLRWSLVQGFVGSLLIFGAFYFKAPLPLVILALIVTISMRPE